MNKIIVIYSIYLLININFLSLPSLLCITIDILPNSFLIRFIVNTISLFFFFITITIQLILSFLTLLLCSYKNKISNAYRKCRKFRGVINFVVFADAMIPRKFNSLGITTQRIPSLAQPDLFRAGRYHLQYKRPSAGAYSASDNALHGRGSGHARLKNTR